MIIIQKFPTVAVLAGWLHNAQLRKGPYDFSEWLLRYTRNRELTVNNRVYRFQDCINLLRMEDLQNAG